jgi:hypothetical protein
LGQLDAPRIQNFEIQVPKGSHLREVFAVCPENGFKVFRRYVLVKKSVVGFILG